MGVYIDNHRYRGEHLKSTDVDISQKELIMTTDREQIRQSVAEHYGALARRAARLGDAAASTEACCGDDCCAPTRQDEAIALTATASATACCDDACCVPAPMTDEERSLVKGLYAQDEVAGLPPAALDAAAGCGNPMAIAELRAGEVVLDLGSGGGIDCFLAAKQVGPQGRVIGVDMTPDMLALARKNAAEVGATNVEFRLGEIEVLPLRDASVDVVISNCVINLSTDKPAVFAEVARVLKPGGRFRVSDIVWTKPRPEDAETAEDWAGCIAGALQIDEFLAGLKNAGLAGTRADAVRFLDEERGLASALLSAEKPAEA
jgi:SAM-dependent methyltransferase